MTASRFFTRETDARNGVNAVGCSMMIAQISAMATSWSRVFCAAVAGAVPTMAGFIRMIRAVTKRCQVYALRAC